MAANQISINDPASTESFISIKMDPQPPAEEATIIKRPGAKGIAYARRAAKGKRFRVEATVDITDANLATALQTYKNFTAKTATITDGANVDHDNIVIEYVDVRSQRADPIIGGINTGSDYIVTVAMDVVDGTVI